MTPHLLPSIAFDAVRRALMEATGVSRETILHPETPLHTLHADSLATLEAIEAVEGELGIELDWDRLVASGAQRVGDLVSVVIEALAFRETR